MGGLASYLVGENVGRDVVSTLAGFHPSPRLPPRHRADSGSVGGGSVKGISEPLTEYPKVPH